MTNLTFDQLLKEQKVTAGYITNFIDNTSKIKQAKLTLGALNKRLKLLEDYWVAYCNINQKLISCSEYDDSDYAKDEIYSATEISYLEASSDIEAMIEEKQKRAPPSTAPDNAAAAQTPAVTQRITLPQLDLPTFDGDPLKWESFRDLFTSMIKDAPGLSGCQKLLYLQSKLTGEAAELVRHTAVTDLNFTGAWEDLEARYGNPRIISSFHMKNLFSIPPVEKSNPNEIRRLIDAFKQSIRAFQALKKPIGHWDEFFVYLLVQKLDRGTRIVWETSLADSKEVPSFQTLTDFLENRVHALEFASSTDPNTRGKASQQPSKTSVNNNFTNRSPKTTLTVSKSPEPQARNEIKTNVRKNPKRSCVLCAGNHSINYCTKFKELTPQARREQINRLNACSNCLRSNHTLKDCTSESRCTSDNCGKAHHTLLHQSPPDRNNYSSDQSRNITKTTSSKSQGQTMNDPRMIHTLNSIAEQPVFIATARVRVVDQAGHAIVLRAVLDTAADASLITEAAASALNLSSAPTQIPITGVNCTSAGNSTREVKFKLKSLRDKTFSMELSALTVPRITNLVPQGPITIKEWSHFAGLPLADPDYAMPGEIDLLISAQATGHLLLDKSRKGSLDEPVARLTPFGWIITGPAGYPPAKFAANHATANFVQSGKFFALENLWDENSTQAKVICHCSRQTETPKSKGCDCFDIQNFWEQEELLETPVLSEEDSKVEKFFEENHKRDKTGRFIVRLPFKLDPRLHLKFNKNGAIALLIAQEKKFIRNPHLQLDYKKFMDEFSELEHMSESSNPDTGFFLPHHGVWKFDPKPKLRVVFNASHVTASGKSLNDCLAAGPKLQTELWTVITRARLFKIFFTADIVKMFRQILVDPQDQVWQQIVWRSAPVEAVKSFSLKTVTYGTNCAPFLALRTLLQLASDEEHRFPLGAQVVRQTSYVDDFLAGADDINKAMEIKSQLTGLLRSGGFELSKWASNTPKLLEYPVTESKLLQESETVSTLGLSWNPVNDSFSLKVAMDRFNNCEPTKRSMLSDIARMFDPLGWYAPVLITAKIMIQNIWLLGLDWDEKISEELLEQWLKFRSALPELEQITIPRWLGYLSSDTSLLEFHTFSDASERAYAATVYLKFANDKNCNCSLVVAKTKVAPVKTVSIPRLELCGALLAARLVSRIKIDLHLTAAPIFAYTDSQVTLSWVKAHASKWPTYVSNRVGKIQTLVPPENWSHVRSAENPADLATRGISPSELRNSTLWWNGPTFLSSDKFRPTTDSTERMVFVTNVEKPKQELNKGSDLLHRFSELHTLIRITAYCLRWLSYMHPAGLREVTSGPIHPLSTTELTRARLKWLKISQSRYYSEEIELLKDHKTLLKRHKIKSLSPFLDDSGLLRVGGRLRQSSLSFDEKHPIILHKRCFLSRLIIREAHTRTLHGGPQLMISHAVRKYWIPHIHPLAKSVLDECVVCARHAAKTMKQIMGDLPRYRLSSIRPFIASGVDYAGPIMIRTTKGRGHKSYKGYICLFVCMATKAIHLEAVSDLTTKAFLAAFARFISRRGHCRSLVSDNGKNFEGADNELREMFNEASDFYKDTCVSLAGDEVDWTFIPPLAPHEGGLWEAGVRSMKHHLKRVIGTKTLTFEEISTLLCQIEACLNSRPLVMFSKNPSDLAPLTPGHFLVGHPLTTLPEPGFENPDVTPVSRYKLISHMRDDFWRRWKEEYLNTLQPRACWHDLHDPIKIGSVVLLKEENTPPSKWPLARVTELKKGPDGHIRHVIVRTATGELKRHLVKLCLLPVAPE